ncbi:MAG: MarR family transcriptional regulator [Cyclobacteriaceae bacterium]
MRENLNQTSIQKLQAASRNYSDASSFMHEAIARQAGLSGNDHKYLGLIMQHQKLTAGELSALTGLTTGAVTGLIDRLEKKKLLKRKFSKDDRRKVHVVPIVDNVMKLLQPVFQVLQQKTLDLMTTFSDSEIQTIERYFVEATAIMIETTNNLNNSIK